MQLLLMLHAPEDDADDSRDEAVDESGHCGYITVSGTPRQD